MNLTSEFKKNVDKIQKSQPILNKNQGLNPLVTAATGLVVRVGVGKMLSDKKNRDKAKEVLGNVSQKVKGYIEKEKIKSKLKKKLKKTEKNVDKLTKTTKLNKSRKNK